MSRIREQAILRDKNVPNQRPGKEPMVTKETWAKDTVKEKVIIHNDHPGQHVLINGKLSIGSTVSTTVPRFVIEHLLQAYPLAEPVIHKKWPLAPNRMKVLKDKVFEWLREGIIRRAQYPGWVANVIPIKQRNGTWQVQMDYTSLNKICTKDMYPFPEIEEELESLMGYQYKCFLRLPKEHSQVRMSKNDKEKIGFHTKEGVAYFTHMPKGLKIFAATLQRMMDKVFGGQKGRNVKEAEGQVVKKFFEHKEQVLHMSDKSKEETFGSKEELIPTLRAWRLYVRREAGKEALLAGLIAFAGRGMKDLHVFVGSKLLVDQVKGSRIPRTKEAKKYREEVIGTTTPFHSLVYEILFICVYMCIMWEIGNQSIECDHLNEIGLMVKFVEFISFTFE
ncbi:reverse transcriptase domain-containing protein [Tanacetum coccineum]